MPEIIGKGVGYIREGVSTQSVLGTPREPFLCAYVLGIKWCLQTNRMGGWEKKSLIIF